MKRALILTALFVVGLLSALTLAGGGIAGYTHTHTYTTTGTTTETVPETTATVLCPNGNPNTGGKDGHPGNDSCALDETTPSETTPTTSPPVETTAPPTTETVTTTEMSPPEVTTETVETTATVTETTPAPPVKPRKPHVKPPCSNGTPRVNGRCHPKVQGSG